jgi:hypothetical protein
LQGIEHNVILESTWVAIRKRTVSSIFGKASGIHTLVTWALLAGVGSPKGLAIANTIEAFAREVWATEGLISKTAPGAMTKEELKDTIGAIWRKGQVKGLWKQLLRP